MPDLTLFPPIDPPEPPCERCPYCGEDACFECEHLCPECGEWTLTDEKLSEQVCEKCGEMFYIG